MDFLGRLLPKKKEPVNPNESIENIKVQIGVLRDKQEIIKREVEKLTLEAKIAHSKKDDKRAAFIIRKIKMQNAQSSQLENMQLKLETQLHLIETSKMQRETINVLQSSTALVTPPKIEDVEDTMQDVQEFHQDVDEISSILGQSLDPNPVDDDELLADFFSDKEVEEVPQKEKVTVPVTTKLPEFPSVPSHTEPLPTVPTETPKKREKRNFMN